MKVIDLLNKIANEEEMPKKIIVHGTQDYVMKLTESNVNYTDNDGDLLFSETYNWKYMLNDEVEIIEEPKKIEKICIGYDLKIEDDVAETYINGNFYKEIVGSKYDEMIALKINEIIDYLNKGQE